MKTFNQFYREFFESKFRNGGKVLWGIADCEDSYNAGAAAKQEEMFEFSEWFGNHVRNCGILRIEPMLVEDAYEHWKNHIES